jgi:hypothetical protein
MNTLKNKVGTISITGGKGVHFTFDNGWTLSIQIGGGNYSENYDFPIGKEKEGRLPPSSTAEIAYWPPSGEMQRFGGKDGDTVKGYVPFNEVLKWISKVSRMKPKP